MNFKVIQFVVNGWQILTIRMNGDQEGGGGEIGLLFCRVWVAPVRPGALCAGVRGRPAVAFAPTVAL